MYCIRAAWFNRQIKVPGFWAGVGEDSFWEFNGVEAGGKGIRN